MPSLGTIWAELGLKLTKFDQALRDAEAKIKKAEEKLEGLQKASERLSNMGKKLTMGVTLPLVGIGTASIKMSNDFNKAMANVATLIPGNTERVNELKRTVQDMAIEFGKRTGDIAGGLYQVISAFGDTSDTVKILEINAKAATAGLATTTDAINLTSAVTKGYGDTTAEAVKKVADLAFQTVKLGQTTFPELAASIGKVVPMAKSMGLSLEELFAVMATLTGVTGTAAEVSTQFRAILQGLQKPSKEMHTALKQLGFESGTAALKTLGLEGVLKGLQMVVGNNADALANLWGQVEAGVAVQALTGGQAQDLTKKLEAMKDAAGAMEEAFEEQTTGINKAGFEWAKFTAKLEVVSQYIGETLAPSLNKLLDYIEKAVDWFASLDESTQDLIIKIGMATATIGPFLFVLGKLGGAIVTLSEAKAVLAETVLVGKLIPALGTTKLAAEGATAATAGLSMASVVLVGKLLLIAGAIYLVYRAIKDWKQVSESMANNSGALLGKSVSAIRGEVDRFTESLERSKGKTQELSAEMAALKYRMDETKAGIISNSKANREMQEEMSSLKNRIKEANIVSQAQSDILNKLRSLMDFFGESAKNAGQKVQDVLTAALDRINLKAEITRAKFELLKARMGDSANEAEVTKARINMLTEQLEAQNEKVSLLSQAYEKMKKLKGETAEETQKLYLELLREQKVQQELQNEISSTNKLLEEQARGMMKITDKFIEFTQTVNGEKKTVRIERDPTRHRKREKEYFQKHKSEIEEIARRQGVDLGVAQEMHKRNMIDRMLGQLPKYANGGIITRPVLMFDLLTGRPAGIAGERGEEAIKPLGRHGTEIDYNKLAQAVENGTYRAVKDAISEPTVGNKPQEIVLMMDGTRLARLLLPKLRAEKQRLGVETI